MLPLTGQQQKLVETHLRIAGIIAHRASKFDIEYDREELFQVACLGLMRAATLYDANRGATFGTYARYRAAGYLYDWLRDQTGSRRLPRKFAIVATDDVPDLPDSSCFTTDIDQADDVEQFLGTLKPRNRDVVRYLIEGKTLKQAGKKIGVSESRVSQILNGILRPALESWLSHTRWADGTTGGAA